MITQTYPSLRQPPTNVLVLPPKGAFTRYPTYHERQRATLMNISGEEYVRRNEIVRKLWIACPFNVGEVVAPKRKEDRDNYGDRLMVRGIYKTYDDFHIEDKWPKDDNPMILTVHSDKRNVEIFCTSNFIIKQNNGGTC